MAEMRQPVHSLCLAEERLRRGACMQKLYRGSGEGGGKDQNTKNTCTPSLCMSARSLVRWKKDLGGRWMSQEGPCIVGGAVYFIYLFYFIFYFYFYFFRSWMLGKKILETSSAVQREWPTSGPDRGKVSVLRGKTRSFHGTLVLV
jgi:hypothetical protein